jgi:hypothetical protein
MAHPLRLRIIAELAADDDNQEALEMEESKDE